MRLRATRLGVVNQNVGGYTALDPDALTYIAAVEAADGQPLENAVRQAIDNLFAGLKTDSIFTAIKACCILAGARTLAGALIPLVGSAPSNFNFVSGDYSRSLGLLGNGSTKYLDSNYNNNASAQNSNHNAVYASTFAANSQLGCGVTGTGTNLLAYTSSTSITVRNRSGTAQVITVSATTSGFMGVSRSGAANYTYRVNADTASQSSTSETPAAGNVFVFARNNAGVANFLSASRLQFYSIGDSIDLALLRGRLDTFFTAIVAAGI